MQIRLVSICLLLGYLLSSCTVPDPAGTLWKSPVGGDTIYPGNQAVYVKKTNVDIERQGGLRAVNINNGEILWELKIVSDKGQLTYIEAGQDKYTLQMDTYLGDNMVEANLKTNVEGYDEPGGVVFVETDENRLGSMTNFKRLYAIRLKDSQILWKVGLDALKDDDLGFEIGRLFVQDGKVSFVSQHYTRAGQIGNDTLYNVTTQLNTYDAAAGRMWAQELSSERDADRAWGFEKQSILAKDGKIYFNRGYPRMWDLRTGEKIDGQTPASIAEQDGNYPSNLVVQDGILYSTDFFSKASIFKGDFFVTAKNVETGKVLSQYTLYKEKTTEETNGPLVTDTSIWVSQGDTLYEFDKKTVRLINQTQLSGQIDNIIIEQNHLFLLCSGTLYAVDLNAARKK